MLYEKDSLKGGGTGTVEVKDISKGAFHKTKMLDIYDYCIVADSIIATDYNGILEYSMASGLYNQLLPNSEHDDMRLLYADEENLIYFNADKCRMSVFDYIDKENKGVYELGELDPVACVMLDNEIYFIESESGCLCKADNQSGKVEALFEAIPSPEDDDITICSKAIAKDKYIYCNGYDGSIYRTSPDNRKRDVVFDAAEIGFDANGYNVEFAESHIIMHFYNDSGLLYKQRNIAIDYEGNIE